MTYSTNYNATYARAKYMDAIEVDERPKYAQFSKGKTVAYIDCLSDQITNIIRFVSVSTPHLYQGEHITTISYQYYGTTTLWWLILAYNGYFHWMEIPAASILRIPSKTQFDAFVSRVVIPSGKTIII